MRIDAAEAGSRIECFQMTFETGTVRGGALTSRKPSVPNRRIGRSDRGDVLAMLEDSIGLGRDTQHEIATRRTPRPTRSVGAPG
jgi:hypothetical protein